MREKFDLKLNCTAIGSLPNSDVNSAMKIVEDNFSQIPFWPQLAKLSKNEDMIVQFLEGIPGLVEGADKIHLENESDEFFENLECFFMDYEEIISNNNFELLEKYAVSEKNSTTFKPFLKMVERLKPDYAKGQIVGPFTLATTLTDKENKCVYYDETLKEIVVKILSLKALWQINEIKKVSPNTVPIIFMDEPSLSQLGTSAFLTISKDEVIEIIKEISDLIKENGAKSAMHCCGKCDWTIPIRGGLDIINLDGYFFAQSLSLFADELKPFLLHGGIIAWGMIPTLDKDALTSANTDSLLKKFNEAIDYLIIKGIDKELLLNNSMITPSCGAGSLTTELAQKAMNLTKGLSLELREKIST